MAAHRRVSRLINLSAARVSSVTYRYLLGKNARPTEAYRGREISGEAGKFSPTAIW